jgi:hypothetical protein
MSSKLKPSKCWRSLVAFGSAVAVAATAPASAVAQNSSSYGRPAWAAGWEASAQFARALRGVRPQLVGGRARRSFLAAGGSGSTGGSLIRIRVSNVYGSAPLRGERPGGAVQHAAGLTVGDALLSPSRSPRRPSTPRRTTETTQSWYNLGGVEIGRWGAPWHDGGTRRLDHRRIRRDAQRRQPVSGRVRGASTRRAPADAGGERRHQRKAERFACFGEKAITRTV